MSKTRWKKKLCGASIGLATLMTGGAAFAEADYRLGSSIYDGNQFGNGNFWAQYSYSTVEESEKYTSGNGHVRESIALASFWVKTRVFGTQMTPIFVQAGGHGFMSKVATNPSQHRDLVYATVELAGNELYGINGVDTPCPNLNANNSCASYSTSVSKTLFNASQTFTVAFVPITVKAKVTGELRGGIAASAYSAKYLGIEDSLYGRASGSLNAGAYARATLTALAGIEDVLAVGVTASIRLLEASVTPTVKSGGVAPWTAPVRARITHTNVMPLTLHSLGGKVDVWADITPLHREKSNLINWPGYTWTTPLSGFSDVTVDL